LNEERNGEAVTVHRRRFGDQECLIAVRTEGGSYLARPFMLHAHSDPTPIADAEGLLVEFSASNEVSAVAHATFFLAKRFGPPAQLDSIHANVKQGRR
jgi:hypothetical protein